ncbi:reverse transcriptase domain, reverse transcriptase zinc-binding domain protein [Tanacetum coccineum]
MEPHPWFDTWADFEPLAAQISPRDIARSGLSLQSKVQDVIHHELWVWPQELLVKYPFLNNYNTPIRDDARDTLVWRNIHGNVKKFSVSQVWDDIRHRDSKVNWKLKMQDLVPMWDVSDLLGMDRVKDCAGLAHYTPNVYDIIQSLMPIMKRRTTNSVVAKLVVAAATYYVWQERNWRLFKKGKRSPDQIVECIKSSVRLKLLSCKLKKSKNGERLARLWDLPEAVGFNMIDTFAETEGIAMDTVFCIVDGVPVLLAKPQTYMNLSGESSGPLAAYYKLPLNRVVVFHDDMDLPSGVLRLQPKGGHGSHNGYA